MHRHARSPDHRRRRVDSGALLGRERHVGQALSVAEGVAEHGAEAEELEDSFLLDPYAPPTHADGRPMDQKQWLYTRVINPSDDEELMIEAGEPMALARPWVHGDARSSNKSFINYGPWNNNEGTQTNKKKAQKRLLSLVVSMGSFASFLLSRTARHTHAADFLEQFLLP